MAAVSWPAVALGGDDEGETDFPIGDEAAPRTVERFRVQIDWKRDFRGGGARPLVVGVLFVDFECGFCGQAFRTLEGIERELKGDFGIAFRPFPLAQHPNARLAARAFVVAARHERGLDLARRLLGGAAGVGREALVEAAAAVGIPKGEFERRLDEPAVGREVAAQVRRAEAIGVEGAPTLFLNGRRIGGAHPAELYREIIRDEIEVAKAHLAKGVAREALYDEMMKGARELAPRAGASRAAAVAGAREDVRIGESPARGAAGADVALVVFADFACRHSADLNGTLKELLGAYPGKLRVAFKSRPLSIHQDGRLAACAAMAAHEQGKFWEMHDVLFKNTGTLGRDDLVKYAADLKLDAEAFRAALDADKCLKEIERDLAAARALGVAETPVSFVNGIRVVGAASVATFRKLIDAELGERARKSGGK